MLPWNPREVLPPEKPGRAAKKAAYSVSGMPTQFVYVLVDLLHKDAKISRGLARKEITRGKVFVNDVVVRDPDTRVGADDVVKYFP